ncbi:MAG: glycosyltransferase family 39 protein [Candidatus Brocadiia bacterium]
MAKTVLKPLVPGRKGPVMTRMDFLKLGVLLAFGAGIRIALMSHPGYVYDFDYFFRPWARDLQLVPFDQFYHQQTVQVDYPPLYLYVLYVVGWVGKLLGVNFGTPLVYDDVATGLGARFLLKTPALFADLGLGVLTYFIARRWFPKFNPLLAAALVVFNPVLLYDGAVWGQVDSIVALFAVAVAVLLASDRLVWASLVYTLSITFKPQMIFMMPVIAAVLLLSLLDRRKWLQMALIPPVVVVSFTMAVAPFAGTWNPWLCGKWFTNLLAEMEGKYQSLSMNMWNFWKALGDALQPDVPKDTASIISGLPAGADAHMPSFHTVGLILIALLSVFVFLMILKRRDFGTIFLGSAVMFLGVSLLGTRMHERYPLPAVILLGFAALSFAPMWFPFAMTSLLNLVNMHAVLTGFLFLVFKPLAEGGYGYEPNRFLCDLSNSKGVVALSIVFFYSSFFLMSAYLFMVSFRKIGDSTDPEEPEGKLEQRDTPGMKRVFSAILAKIPDVTAISDTAFFQRILRFIGPRAPVTKFVRADVLILLFFLFVGGAIYFFNYWNPPYLYFDEEYFAKTDRQIAQLESLYPIVGYPWETTHPHMGKLLQASFIKMFGFQPWSYRIPNLLFGVLTILFLYMLARDIFKSRRMGFFSAFFFMLCGLGFAQSRLCTIDAPSVFFMVLAFFCFYKYFGKLWPALPALTCTAVAIGLAISSKWTSVFAMGMLITLMFVREGWDLLAKLNERHRAKVAAADAAAVAAATALAEPHVEPLAIPEGGVIPPESEPVPAPTPVPIFPSLSSSIWRFLAGMSGLLIFLVLVPLCIYAFSFVRLIDMDQSGLAKMNVYKSKYDKSTAGKALWLALSEFGEPVEYDRPATGDPDEDKGRKVTVVSYSAKTLKGVFVLALEKSRDMYEYHSGVGTDQYYTPHPYESRWYHWPLLLKIIWYDSFSTDYYDTKQVAGVVAIGNPLLFWFGLPCVIFLLWGIFEELSWGLVFVAAGFVFLYLPWVISPRKVTFLYHYLPAQPFMAMAVAYTMEDFWHDKLTRLFTILFVVAVVIVFFYFYPLLNFLPLSESAFKARLWNSAWGVGY